MEKSSNMQPWPAPSMSADQFRAAIEAAADLSLGRRRDTPEERSTWFVILLACALRDDERLAALVAKVAEHQPAEASV